MHPTTGWFLLMLAGLGLTWWLLVAHANGAA
jgi:hypothetical protein